MFIRTYLRASTFEQDASRAKSALDVFAAEHGLRIAARYVKKTKVELSFTGQSCSVCCRIASRETCSWSSRLIGFPASPHQTGSSCAI